MRKLNLEQMVKSLDRIDLLSVNDIIDLKTDLSFYIAKYQRGYRWDKDQVRQLLKDVDKNEIGKTYCLQPVSVIEKASHFEVIDGQQRLTTLYIILSVLEKMGAHRQPIFNIDYATRTSCVDFLKKIKLLPFVGREDQIELAWEQLPKEERNIDNYHIHQSYQIIKLWLENKEKADQTAFVAKLRNDLKIIWYPITITNHANAKKLFRNINSGKIRLTSSDLIKALFVLQFQKSQDSISLKKVTIPTWDKNGL